jgi:hypothetical protein
LAGRKTSGGKGDAGTEHNKQASIHYGDSFRFPRKITISGELKSRAFGCANPSRSLLFKEKGRRVASAGLQIGFL